MLGINFKKIIPVIMFFVLFSAVPQNVFADEVVDNEIDYSQFLNFTKQKTDDKKEIKKTLKLLDKYIRSKNTDGIKSLISDNFINNDGFDKNSFVEMLKSSWELYPDMKGSMEINNIIVDNNNAEVFVKDYGKGKITDKDNPSKQSGTIKTYTENILFLQKYGNEWKLQSIYTIKEKSILAYSDAQLADINLEAPSLVAPDTDYSAELILNSSKNEIPFASIDNEVIEFPNKTLPDMVFKSMITDNSLERVVKTNNKGKNEYIIATIGLVQPQFVNSQGINDLSDMSKFILEIKGMAIVITRVNVSNQKQDYVRI